MLKNLKTRPLAGRAALGAILLGTLGLAPTSNAQLITINYEDPNTPFIAVNGTEARNIIVLTTLANGGIRVQMSDGDAVRNGLITPGQAASLPVVVFGKAGNDIIDTRRVTAIRGFLEVYAGDGNDIILCGNVNHYAAGDNGNDILIGGDADDILFGDLGSRDALVGGLGNDSLNDVDGVSLARGGAGNDTFGLVFQDEWDDNAVPDDQRVSDGRINGGDGDDYFIIAVFGSAIAFNISGDEPMDPNVGGYDVAEIFGDVTGSIFPNMEDVYLYPIEEYLN